MSRRDPRLAIVGFLSSAVIALVFIIAYARNPALFQRGKDFRAVFRSAAGLNLGDDVRYGGVRVGLVTDIAIDSADVTRIAVRIRVKNSTPVRVDTRATITQVGLLGEPYLALTPGSNQAQALASGSTLKSDESMSVQDAMTQLARFFERTDTLLTGAQRFASTNPWDRLDRTLTRFDKLIESTATNSDKVLGQVDVASERLTSMLARTDRLIAHADSALQAATPGIGETQREALSTLRDTRELVAQLREALDQGGGVEQLVRDLGTTTDNLARLTTRLERDPSSLLKKRSLPRKTAGPPLRD